MKGLVVLLLLCLCSTAHADRMKPGAAALFERGVSLFEQQQYEEALSALRNGYAIDPHPDFFYPLAQAYRLTGDCESAIPLYEKARDRHREWRTRIQSLIDKCRTPSEPELEPEPAPPSGHLDRSIDLTPRQPPPAPPHPPPSPARRDRAFYQDALGDSLAIGGLVAVGIGTGFLLAASNTESSIEDGGTYQAFLDRGDKADRERLIGTIALATGAALLTGAVIRWVLVDVGEDRAVMTAAVRF